MSHFCLRGHVNRKIKPKQKLGYSRAELFIQLDKPALQPLPEASYTLVKKVRVHADYHVETDKHYYSVSWKHGSPENW